MHNTVATATVSYWPTQLEFQAVAISISFVFFPSLCLFTFEHLQSHFWAWSFDIHSITWFINRLPGKLKLLISCFEILKYIFWAYEFTRSFRFHTAPRNPRNEDDVIRSKRKNQLTKILQVVLRYKCIDKRELGKQAFHARWARALSDQKLFQARLRSWMKPMAKMMMWYAISTISFIVSHSGTSNLFNIEWSTKRLLFSSIVGFSGSNLHLKMEQTSLNK